MLLETTTSVEVKGDTSRCSARRLLIVTTATLPSASTVNVEADGYSSYYATWWMTRLGCRRRSCQAAICFGEAHGAFDPKIAEWDFSNPSGSIRKDGERPELKHLSKGRKRNQMR